MASEVLQLRKRGAGNVLAILKRGGKSFHSLKVGEGAQMSNVSSP